MSRFMHNMSRCCSLACLFVLLASGVALAQSTSTRLVDEGGTALGSTSAPIKIECIAGCAGSGAPVDAQYWVGAADATLTAEKNLGALATGLVINTAGVPTAYAGSACAPNFVQDISASGVASCAAASGLTHPQVMVRVGMGY